MPNHRTHLLGLATLLLYGSLAPAYLTSSAQSESGAVSEAREVMVDFMTTFNARDEVAWAETFNYPHIRIAGGQVRIAENIDAIIQEMDFDRFAEMTGWHYSAWDSVDVVHASDDKVHFAVEFTRFDEAGQSLQTYQSLYVVTNLDGHWGIQLRSSFAP